VEIRDYLKSIDLEYVARRGWVLDGRALTSTRMDRVELQVAKACRVSPHLVPEEMDAIAREIEADEVRKKEQCSSEVPKYNEQEFIEKYMEDYGVKILATGSVQGGDIRILKGLAVDYNARVSRIPKKIQQELNYQKICFEPLIIKWESMVIEKSEQRLEKIRRHIQYHGREHIKHKPLLRMLTDTIVNKADPDRELHARVIEHMLWQVKRKLFGYDAKDHVLLYLHGKQGCGKTELIRRIGQTLRELYTEPDMQQLLTDRFNKQLLHSYYMANLEEFAGSETAGLGGRDKRGVSGLKKLLTTKIQTQRDMYVTTVSQFKNNLTIFGSGNDHLKVLVNDYTGMRRLWEIDVDKVLNARRAPTLDWTLVEAIDYRGLWREIDEEDDESPIRRDTDVFERIAQSQDLMRSKTTFELWLEKTKRWPVTDPSAAKLIHIYQAEKEFRDWSREWDPSSRYGRAYFHRQIDKVGVESEEINGNRYLRFQDPLYQKGEDPRTFDAAAEAAPENEWEDLA